MFVLMRNSVFKKNPLYIGSVTQWQEYLQEQEFDLGITGADGRFGARTEQATRKFQRRSGLVDDGKVGPKTIAHAEQANFNGGLKVPEPEIIDGTPLAQVKGSERVSIEFKRKVVQIGQRLDIDPSHLMAVMAFETGFTFSPTIRNPHSQMVGLIQFGNAAATDLGTTVTKLSQMTDLKQLVFVEKYFEMRKRLGDLSTVEDVYMAVLFPKLIGKPMNAIMAERGSKVYKQNSGLDRSNDGRITKAEAAFQVTQILNGAKKVPIETSAGDVDAGNSASFGTALKKGDSGSEVQEVQTMLVALGHMTQAQMNTGIGVFGPKTEKAVEEFQHDNDVEYSGAVTDETLAALREAFRKQPPEEKVDPKGIKTQIQAVGEGFVTYGPRHKKFTTARIARDLERLSKRWRERHPNHLVQIGNISKRGGGPLSPHKSHRKGLDVDFRPFCKDGGIRPVKWTSPKYDQTRTREFIDLAREMFPGARILFNDPDIVKTGKTRKVSGHDNHLHITFPAT